MNSAVVDFQDIHVKTASQSGADTLAMERGGVTRGRNIDCVVSELMENDVIHECRVRLDGPRGGERRERV